MQMDESTADYYQILGVAYTADTATIKRAYRQKISQHHPDRGADDAWASRLNIAYATLKDANTRQAYDAHLAKVQQRQWLNRRYSQLAGVGKQLQGRMMQTAQSVMAAWGRFERFYQQLPHLAGKQVDIVCRIDLQTAYFGGKVSITTQQQRHEQAIELDLPSGLGAGEIVKVRYAERLLRVRIWLDNPCVQLKGADVYYVVYLTAHQMMEGAKITLPAPLSLTLISPACLDCPADIVLTGRGLPTADGTGDLVVQLRQAT